MIDRKALLRPGEFADLDVESVGKIVFGALSCRLTGRHLGMSASLGSFERLELFGHVLGTRKQPATYQCARKGCSSEVCCARASRDLIQIFKRRLRVDVLRLFLLLWRKRKERRSVGA